MPLVFEELNDTEWKEIVAAKLSSKFLNGLDEEACRSIALNLVNFHRRFREESTGNGKLQERNAYTEVSIRDLLQVTQHIVYTLSHELKTPDGLMQVCAFEAWSSYGVRFREVRYQNLIRELISSEFNKKISLNEIRVDSLNINPSSIQLQDLTYYFRTTSEFDPPLPPSNPLEAIAVSHPFWSTCSQQSNRTMLLQAATNVVNYLYSHDFMSNFGLYFGARNWFAESLDWLKVFSDLSGAELSKEVIGSLCAQNYMDHLRCQSGRDYIAKTFCEIFQIQPEAIAATKRKLKTLTENRLLNPSEKSIVRNILSGMEAHTPVALTQRLLQTLLQLIRAVRIQIPVLIVGVAGCGKSTVIHVLAELCNQNCHKLYITSETEVSQLVGSQRPQTNKGKAVDWEDGLVTVAVKRGEWCLLDNLSDADSCVLERLNPLLEQFPEWTLSEAGETERLFISETYRTFATMTCGKGCAELSPALYNRFNNIYMQKPPAIAERSSFVSECESLTRAILGFDEPLDIQATVAFLLELWTDYGPDNNNSSKLIEHLSFRKLICILNCTYKLLTYYRAKGEVVTVSQGLMAAFSLVLRGQFKIDENANDEAEIAFDKLKGLLARTYNSPIPSQLKVEIVEDSQYHILPNSRKKYAEQLLSSIICGFPILLEGPAAVGKTSLVTMLAVGRGKQLERVNNTLTTTIQDYLGSYIPVGDSFIFQQGALYRAMVAGDWFLSDEFNLADPNIMNMLVPILEGAKEFTIPGTDERIVIGDGFRFFATQNPDGKYAGRNKLPPTLRSRFIEVQIGDFTIQELEEILLRRKGIIPGNVDRISVDTRQKIAKALATVYTKINALKFDDMQLTMREIIKWSRRRLALFPEPLNEQHELHQWCYAGWSLLMPKLNNTELITKLKETLSSAFHVDEVSPNLDKQIFTVNPQDPSKLTSISVDNIVLADIDLNLRRCSFTFEQWPKKFQIALARLFVASRCNEPCLLVGVTSYKSLLISTWLELTNSSSEVCHLAVETESSDLLGQMYPFSAMTAIQEAWKTSTRMNSRVKSIIKSLTRSDGIDHERDSVLAELNVGIDSFADSLLAAAKEMTAKFESLNSDQVEDLPPPVEVDTRIDLFTEEDDYVPVNLSTSNEENYYNNEEFLLVSQSNAEENIGEYDYSTADNAYSSESMNYYDYSSYDQPMESGMEDSNYFTADSSNPYYEDGSAPTDNFDGEASPDFDFSTMFAGVRNEQQPSEEAFDSIDKNDIRALKEQIETAKEAQESQASMNKCISDFITVVKTFDSLINRVDALRNDAAVLQLLNRLRQIYKAVSETTSKPIFAFREGPVTKAIIQGLPLVLEDFNLPSQAVTERLNSVLEPEPTFSLTEDISRTCGNEGAGGQNISVLSSFQVFATAHKDVDSQKLNLSPAARSRFTEIQVQPYSDADIIALLSATLQKDGSVSDDNANALAHCLVELSRKVNDLSASSPTLTILQLLKACRFIRHESQSQKPFPERLLLSARFMLLDSLTTKNIASILEGHTDGGWKSYCDRLGLRFDELTDALFGEPTPECMITPLKYVQNQKGLNMIACTYTNVVIVSKSKDRVKDLSSKLHPLEPTTTVCKNIARIFASFTTNSALLLQGPPGIGKTAIVLAVANIVDAEVERINFSASTSVEQLFGSIVPCVGADGRRAFVWQDGKMLSAIRSNKWLLLDEVNLAPANVLECLIPLLKRDKKLSIPGSDEDPLDISDVQIVATMNPVSVGGNRTKLSRSMENLFTVVSLDGYDDFEMKKILWNIFKDLLPRDDSSEWGVITSSQLDTVFDFHNRIRELVDSRKIGCIGGPFEINLRDLTKLRDVLRGNAKSLRDHFRFYNGGEQIDPALVTANAVQSAKEMLNTSNGKLSTTLAQMRRRVTSIGSDAEVQKCLQCFIENPTLMTLKGKFFTSAVAKYGYGTMSWEAALAVLTSVSTDSDDIRTLTLRKFVDLVYTRQFQSISDQALVRLEIDKYFKISEELSSIDDRGIDISVSPMVRVGTIYLESGNEVNDSESSSSDFIYTPRTVNALESLAAAVQCSRPVLLEGDTCSGKNALIRELAYLCKRKLIVMSMTHETETSTLIGQWLPIPMTVQAGKRRGSFYKYCHKILQFIFAHIFAVVDTVVRTRPLDSSGFQLLSTIENMACKLSKLTQLGAKSGSASEQLEAENSTLVDIKTLLYNLKDAVDIPFTPFARMQISYLLQSALKFEKSKNEKVDTEGGIVFDFVESDLIRAIREGYWILLDNVNSAPPEVIERLNSLFEDNPTLNLVESGGDMLSIGSGIHENFRIFVTANGQRPNSYKLSAAFLNRVIRIWLESMDANITKKTCTQHDSFGIINSLLPDIAGKSKLTSLLLSLHGQMSEMITEKAIGMVGNMSLTFRSAIRTVTSFKTLWSTVGNNKNSNITVVDAFVWAMVRSYVNCTKDNTSATLILTEIKDLLQDPDIVSTSEQATAMSRRRLNAPNDIDFDEFLDSQNSLQWICMKALTLSMLSLPSIEDFNNIVLHISRSNLFDSEVDHRIVTDLLARCLNVGTLDTKIDALEALSIPCQDWGFGVVLVEANTTRLEDICTTLEAELKESVKSFLSVALQVARNSSFMDATLRTKIIQKAQSINSSIVGAISLIETLNTVQENIVNILTVSLISRMKSLLRPLSILSSYHNWMNLVSAIEIQELVAKCSDLLSTPINSTGSGSLRYLLTKTLASPLSKGVHSLVKMIEYIDREEPNLEMKRLSVAVQWIGAAWSCVFKIPILSVISGANNSPAFDFSKLFKVRKCQYITLFVC